jgi:hypothetical protein
MVHERSIGSRVEEEITPDACILKWRLPSSGLGWLWHLKREFVLGLLFFGLLAWILTGNPWAMLHGDLAMLFLVLLLGVASFRRARPEVLTLGAAHFRHDLGRPGGWWATVDSIDNRPAWRWLPGPPVVVELPKEELGQVVVERATGHLRLLYDVGADRVEIGRYLSEPEKEWLAEVIRQWQGAG